MSGALDLVPVAITYNVFLDGLAARFPHNVFTITFSMDERGRGFSFAFWGEGAVDILNSVRDFFEANAHAANPEDMPQFEFEDMLQRELQWPE